MLHDTRIVFSDLSCGWNYIHRRANISTNYRKSWLRSLVREIIVPSIHQLSSNKKPLVLTAWKQNLISALFKSYIVLKDAGMLNSFKVKEKPTVIPLFSQFICYLPGMSQVTGSEGYARGSKKKHCYLAQNRKSRVEWKIYCVWLTESPIHKVHNQKDCN